MTLAIAHRSILGKAICDGFWERRPPFSPQEVAREFSEVVKSYGVEAVVGDCYSGEWVREAFRENGVDYLLADRTKSEIFLECLALINSGRAKVPRDKRLRAQFLSLERSASRSGKDSISHPPGGHDDLVNAVCGSLLLAAEESGGGAERCLLEFVSGTSEKPLPPDWATRPPDDEERLWHKIG
jgi:hypothetical protein